MNRVYCRQLEDKSGFGVFDGTKKDNQAGTARDRWEIVLGVGRTKAEALEDFHSRFNFSE